MFSIEKKLKKERNRSQDIIRKTIDRLSDLLSMHSFKLPPVCSESQKSNDVQWFRDCITRNDVVTLIYPHVCIDDVIVNFEVNLPVPFRDTEETHYCLDCITIVSERLPLPALVFENTRRRQFIGKLVDKISASLDWFDQIGTPKDFVYKLENSGRSGAPHVALAIDFLTKLKSWDDVS